MAKQSMVVKIYRLFLDGCWCSSMNCTREKAAAAFDNFWDMLIRSGFNFEKTDLVDLDVYCHEGHYSLAVRNGNISFAYAYEEKHKRTPFIGTDHDYSGCHPGFSNHATQAKSAGRLVESARFHWRGELVKVTSFNDKKKSLVACAYHKRKDGYQGKVKKSFKITAEEYRKEMSSRKKLNKTNLELNKKGIKVLGDRRGFYVVKRIKTKSKFYDTTGEVKGGQDLKKYKLFKEFTKAVEFATTLK